MNHPFPRNLPLLRRIYAGRFSAVRFLIPFERSDDPDVITVYRGSYVHAAYLADARAELEKIDCDYYVVVHDDVLLNPRLSEESFSDFFELGPDEGFLPVVNPAPLDIGAWAWHFGLIAKLLFPKSILFGSGIEAATLARFLPSADALRQAIAKAGVEPAATVRLDVRQMDGLAASGPSRLLLHGLAEVLNAGSDQRDVDNRSFHVAHAMIETMQAALTAQGGATRTGSDTLVSLPIPLVSSGYTTDCYIVPKSGFNDYCHYMGVAGAANLFVEVIAPTLLFACCSRVRTGAELALDFSGFSLPKSPDWFLNRRAAAIHPFKLSAIAGAEQQDAFIAMLNAIAAQRVPDAEHLQRAGFGLSIDSIIRRGWGTLESWGTWAQAGEALLELPLAGSTDVRLHLRAPLHPTIPHQTGMLSFDGGDRQVPFAATLPYGDIAVDAPNVRPDVDGLARIIVTSDRLVVPAELGGGSLDTRSLGFGIIGAEWDGHRCVANPAIPGTGR